MQALGENSNNWTRDRSQDTLRTGRESIKVSDIMTFLRGELSI